MYTRKPLLLYLRQPRGWSHHPSSHGGHSFHSSFLSTLTDISYQLTALISLRPMLAFSSHDLCSYQALITLTWITETASSLASLSLEWSSSLTNLYSILWPDPFFCSVSPLTCEVFSYKPKILVCFYLEAMSLSFEDTSPITDH